MPHFQWQHDSYERIYLYHVRKTGGTSIAFALMRLPGSIRMSSNAGYPATRSRRRMDTDMWEMQHFAYPTGRLLLLFLS